VDLTNTLLTKLVEDYLDMYPFVVAHRESRAKEGEDIHDCDEKDSVAFDSVFMDVFVGK